MLTHQECLNLKLTKEMTVDEILNALNTAETYIKERQIHPLIAEIVQQALHYAKDTFAHPSSITRQFNRLTVKDNRYDIVSEIFNAGVASTGSLEHQKRFFNVVQAHLQTIQDDKSDLRDNCLLSTLNNEIAFVKEIEDNVPSHRDAANGIVSASVIMGFLSAFVFESPVLFLISCAVFATKFTPAAKGFSSPSLLGQAVYLEPSIRAVGQRLHQALPVGLSHRLFSIFKKGSALGLSAAEKTLNVAERILDHQKDARQYLANKGHVTTVEKIEDITLSEVDSSYIGETTLSRQLT